MLSLIFLLSISFFVSEASARNKLQYQNHYHILVLPVPSVGTHATKHW